MRNAGADPEAIARLSWGSAPPEGPVEEAIADAVDDGASVSKSHIAEWIWIGYHKLRSHVHSAAETFYAVALSEIRGYLDEVAVDQRSMRALFIDVFTLLELEERAYWADRRAKILNQHSNQAGGETPPESPPPTGPMRPGESRTMLGPQARRR